MQIETLDQLLRKAGAAKGRRALKEKVDALLDAIPSQAANAQVKGVAIDGRADTAIVREVINRLSSALEPLFEQDYGQQEVKDFLAGSEAMREQIRDLESSIEAHEAAH